MSDRTSRDHDEQRLAELIRRGGARLQPPVAAREAVRSAVLAEWRDMVAERARRRRARWSLAAAAAAAGVALWLAVPVLQVPAVTVARIERVEGPVQIVGAGWLGRAMQALAGGSVAAGGEVRADATGRVALRIGGSSVRLDHDSVVAMVDADHIELRRGALYVDSGADGAQDAQLLVATAYGTVEHLGTQYEARLLDDSLSVRVREGVVRIDHRNGPAVDGAAGEQLLVLAGGAVQRTAITRAGGDWRWVGDIAPQYDLENHSLLDFLRWAGRETGREISFESPAAQVEASRVTLRGSTAGLSPERALPAVLSTTQLTYSEQAGRLLIGFRTGENN